MKLFFLIIYVLFKFNLVRQSKVLGNENVEVSEPNSQDLGAADDDIQAMNGVQNQIEFAWPLGIIPYLVNAEVYDSIIMYRIESVMKLISTASCVEFKKLNEPPPKNMTWLHFTNPNNQRDCRHVTSMYPTGEVIVPLGFDCMQRVDILHAILHALGFKDEVTHPQRDLYIKIYWENIQPQYRKLFNIQIEDAFKTLVEYDPLSVMHFHDKAFSSNGAATISPLIPGLMINPSENMSQLDKMKLRLAFGHECNKRKVADLLDICKNVFHESSAKNKTIKDIQRGGKYNYKKPRNNAKISANED